MASIAKLEEEERNRGVEATATKPSLMELVGIQDDHVHHVRPSRVGGKQ